MTKKFCGRGLVARSDKKPGNSGLRGPDASRVDEKRKIETMAMGINTESSPEGGFMGYVQYDAKAGRMFRPDRSQDSSGGWQTEKTEITGEFQAVMDFENLKVGWIAYPAGSAPIMNLVPLGEPFPARPEGDKFKQGFQMIVKLGAACGGEVRTFSHTAKAVLGPIDELHDAYVAGVKDNPGKLPVVKLDKTVPIVTGSGDKKSTSYGPVFSIVKWVDRPAELNGEGGDAPKAETKVETKVEEKPKESAPPAGGDEF